MTRDEWWEVTKILNFIVFDEKVMYWPVFELKGNVLILGKIDSEEEAMKLNWIEEMEERYG